MRNVITVFLIGLLLLAAACGHAERTENTTAEETFPQPPSSAAAETQAEATEDTTAETDISPTVPEDVTFLGQLPGMIMSDVHVRLWDGDVAPGLRAEDAETVKHILAAQMWEHSYDNLSDVWIEAEGVRYAYDTRSGILTCADDRAAKLDEANRAQVNAILAQYLPGYTEDNGFFEP